MILITKEKYISYERFKSAKRFLIIKQYVKQHFPNIKATEATSSVYSGGSSVDVHVSNKDGSSVDPIIFDNIKNREHKLKGGTWNGMIDLCEVQRRPSNHR